MSVAYDEIPVSGFIRTKDHYRYFYSLNLHHEYHYRYHTDDRHFKFMNQFNYLFTKPTSLNL